MNHRKTLPSRMVLEGVPKIGYNIRLSPFPGSVEACMAYLGDLVDYDYIMGVSGAAFRRLFNKEDGGNIDLMYLAPEPHTRIFEAIGYECDTIPRDKAVMVRAIKKSINNGRPVIAFGIIGPPEAGIVTGYDEDGEVLLGYSYFQDPSETGYYERSDWFEIIDPGGPYGLIVIGDRKKSKPSQREILTRSLEWAIDLARAPKRANRPDHASGLAAYDAWADSLLVDSDFPASDEHEMGTRLMVHGDQSLMLEERRCAAKYLRQMAEVAPEVSGELEAAAELYDQAADHGVKVWPWNTCDYGSETLIKGLADRTRRVSIAKAIRAAAAKEARAVEHLEKALAALNA